MPEGDTVWRACKRLHEALADTILTTVDIRWGEHDGSFLEGAKTLEVVPYGKHLLHRTDNGYTIHSHLRMEGNWTVKDTQSVSRYQLKHHTVRAVVANDTHTCIGRLLGMLEVVRTKEEAKVVGHLGPDILDNDWNEYTMARVLDNIARNQNSNIGEALLDQRNLAGIGTVYCSETLFIERIFPWMQMKEVSEEQLCRIIERCRKLMRSNLNHGFRTTTGVRRKGQHAFVHSRSGLPCRRCGTLIRVSQIGTAPTDRVMFSCPSCQGGIGPHDDGKFQPPLRLARGTM